MDSKHLIYALIDPITEEIRYVGRSSSGLKRPYQHATPSRLRWERTRKSNWIKSLLGQGLKPLVEVLETFDSEDPLNEAEQFWISMCRFWGFRLTNATAGGEGCAGRRQGPEERAKRSAMMKGRKQSEEHRRNSAAARRGKKASAETRQRQSVSHTGKKWSDEVKAKIRASHIGKKAPADVRHRVSVARGGRPFSDENGVIYQTLSEAAKALKVDPSDVSKILRGKKKVTKGHTFKWVGT